MYVCEIKITVIDNDDTIVNIIDDDNKILTLLMYMTY